VAACPIPYIFYQHFQISCTVLLMQPYSTYFWFIILSLFLTGPLLTSLPSPLHHLVVWPANIHGQSCFDFCYCYFSYSMLHFLEIHCIASHPTVLHCVADQCIALYFAPHCILSQLNALSCIAYIVRCCAAWHSMGLHSVACHCPAWHSIALHSVVQKCLALH